MTPEISPKDRFITVYGRNPVHEVLLDPDLHVDKVVIAEGARGAGLAEIRKAAGRRGVTLQSASAERVKKLSGNGRQDQGVFADVVAPRIAGRWETLHACYRRVCLPPIETRLRAGRLKVADLLDEVRVLAIEEGDVARLRAPEVVFMNVNTPEELEAARRLVPALEPAQPR